MVDQVHINDIGTAYRVEIQENFQAVDISTAVGLRIIFTRPDGTEVDRAGEFTNDGTDGLAQYVSVDGDIDQLGRWRYRAKVTFNGPTRVFHTVSKDDYDFDVVDK